MLVRALTFRKCFEHVGHSNNDWWVTLGHMDEMECSGQTSMTLEDISKFNEITYKRDSEKAYHHVIYLIDSEFPNDVQQTDSKLWNTEGEFLSVVRIHFPNTIRLQEHFTKLRVYLSKLALLDDYREINWRTYYTVELSDTVLVSRSKKFHILSQWSLQATNCELVGSAYTYFCIPGSLIKGEVELSGMENDYIDFMSIRFAIRGGAAEDELQKARECLDEERTGQLYRVTGNEDAIICAEKIPMERLVRLYRMWYEDGSNILNIFYDIITRIGIGWEGAATKSGMQNDLERYSYQVQKKVLDKVVKNDDAESLFAEHREWLRPLIELTNTLVHMSRTAILDESVFLILPGLNAFWDNVICAPELLNKPLYLEFAELCIHTMEHLMRAEGQLSHRPEVRPLTYDIPAFVLEYATIFLLSFSDELKKLDDTKTNTFCFLLAPSAKMDVDTVELFRPNGETQGLLQITIPYSLLYNPNRLLPALCHELAHYMGERFRMREERYYFFLDCVACELMKYCFDNVISNREKFLKYLALDFLDNTLKCNYEIETGESCEGVYRQPLLDIAERVCRIADELKIIEAYAELARDYVLSDYCGAQFFGLSERELVSQLPLFANRISDLRISFRETYADICMLHFLELSAIDYLEVALPKMGELNTGIYLRIYISLSTAEHSLMDIQTAVQKWGELYTIDAEEINRAHNELKVIADLIESGEICSERYLADYIKKCWSELNKERSGDGKGAHTVKEIYSKILELNNTTDYQDILNIIDYGRQVTFALLEEM